MKSSLTSFEQHEVTKNLSMYNNQVNIILTMNGKYETSMVNENPEDIKVDPMNRHQLFNSSTICYCRFTPLHKQQMHSLKL